MFTLKSRDYRVLLHVIIDSRGLGEPPDADPHVRWCERESGITRSLYSIEKDNEKCEAGGRAPMAIGVNSMRGAERRANVMKKWFEEFYKDTAT